MKLPPTSDRARLAVILAVALTIRVWSLGRADLWTDEIQTLHAVQLGWTDLVAERLRAGHVPLYFVVEKAWTSIAGTSQFALRFPAAILGAALLGPAWSLFRRLSGEKSAWAGTALLAVHPLFVELSREARMYSLLALAALVVADRAAATLDGERPGASFWIAAAIGPFIHPTWGVAMLPFLTWFAIERRVAAPDLRGASKRALIGVGASLAVLVVALAFAHPQLQLLTRRPWPREIGVFALRMIAGSDLGRFHERLPLVVFVVAWATSIACGVVAGRGRERRFAFWIAAGVPVVSVAAGLAGGMPWGPARYVEFGAIGLVVFAAIAARPYFPAAAAPLFLICLMSSIEQLSGDRTPWSTAAQRITVVPLPVVVDDESSRIVLSHYLGRDVFVVAPPPGATQWWHASLVIDGATRRVRLSR